LKIDKSKNYNNKNNDNINNKSEDKQYRINQIHVFDYEIVIILANAINKDKTHNKEILFESLYIAIILSNCYTLLVLLLYFKIAKVFAYNN